MLTLLSKVIQYTDWKKCTDNTYSGIQWYPEYKHHSCYITKDHVILDNEKLNKKAFVRLYNLSVKDAKILDVTYEYYTDMNSIWYGTNKLLYFIYKDYHIIDTQDGIAICHLTMPTTYEWFKVYKIPNNYCIWNKDDLIHFVQERGIFLYNKKFILNGIKYIPYTEKHIPTIRPNYSWNIPCRLLTWDKHYWRIHAITMKEKD